MLFWLLQAEDAHPAIAQGQAPVNLLSTGEQDELEQYTSLARRRDWLLGRWTAKRLLQQIAGQHCSCEIPLQTIVIRTAPDGAPLTNFRQPLCGEPFSISLSHSHGYALCGALPGESVPVGVDLEWVAPHDRAFASSYLSPEEEALVDGSVRRIYDLHVNAIWSAKEATLKALRLQQRLDLRGIHCLIRPLTAEPQTWIPFRIVVPQDVLPAHALVPLTGWWQTLGGFVLTVVTSVSTRDAKT